MPRKRLPVGEDAAFAVWLAPTLHSLFDEVAIAPVPPEFAALLAAAAGRKQPPEPLTSGDC